MQVYSWARQRPGANVIHCAGILDSPLMRGFSQTLAEVAPVSAGEAGCGGIFQMIRHYAKAIHILMCRLLWFCL